MEANTISIPERDNEYERVIAIVFNMTPQQAALVSCLSRGAVATAEQLKEYLNTETHPKIVVHHVRAKLNEKGIDIKSKWNAGYWMEEDTINAIKAEVDTFIRSR